MKICFLTWAVLDANVFVSIGAKVRIIKYKMNKVKLMIVGLKVIMCQVKNVMTLKCPPSDDLSWL